MSSTSSGFPRPRKSPKEQGLVATHTSKGLCPGPTDIAATPPSKCTRSLCRRFYSFILPSFHAVHAIIQVHGLCWVWIIITLLCSLIIAAELGYAQFSHGSHESRNLLLTGACCTVCLIERAWSAGFSFDIVPKGADGAAADTPAACGSNREMLAMAMRSFVELGVMVAGACLGSHCDV